MTRPQRLQRSRKRGARTPEGAVYVGRPTKWGNPFAVDRFGHKRAVNLHRSWLRGKLAALSLERLGFDPAEIDAMARLRSHVLADLPYIAGRDLQCWCPLTSRWCHANTLLELANGAA